MGLLSDLASRFSSLAARIDGAPALPTFEVPRVDAAESPAPRNDGVAIESSPFSWWAGLGVDGLNDEAIEDICRSQLMWRIVTLLVDDAMKLSPDLSGPVLGQLDEVWDYLCARHFPYGEHFSHYYSRMYGGGATYMHVDDGRPLDQPIDLLGCRGIVAFIPIRKRFITPGPASSDMRGGWWGPTWGRPAYYVITPWTGNVDTGPSHSEALRDVGISDRSMSKVHPSRVLAYPYRRLDWLQARRFATWKGWGPGVVEGVVDAFLARTKGVLRTGDIVNSFGYDYLQMDNLHSMLSSPGGRAQIQNYVSAMKQARDFTGDGVPVAVVGPETKIQPVSRTVTGLADLIEAQREFLLDVCEYPRVVLFGETAAGLGTGTAAGEWQTYYQLVSSFLAGPRWNGIRQAAIVAMASSNGPTGGRVDMGVVAAWGSLEEERESDRAEARKRDSEAREKDAITLGLSGAQMIKYDNTLEIVYPGIQADLENGDLVLAAPSPEVGAPAGSPSAPVDASVPMASQGLADAPGGDGGGDSSASGSSHPAGPAGSTPPAIPENPGFVAAPPEAPVQFPSDLIKESEAKRILRCGPGTFARWVSSGALQPYYVGGGRNYSAAEVYKAATTAPPKRAAPVVGEEDEGDAADVEGKGKTRADAYRGDPFENEHAARQASPSGFDIFRRKQIAPGVTLVLGKNKAGKMVAQSVRLSASEFSPSEAREWLREHGYKTALEVASGGRTDDADATIGGLHVGARSDAGSPIAPAPHKTGDPISFAPLRTTPVHAYGPGVTGWRGWSEADGWIAFWPYNSDVALLWKSRDKNGGVVGSPVWAK